MKVSINSDKEINTLIPKLLERSNDLSKEIKTRIKANLIFNEFEKKAQNEFNYFINDSNKRYTNAKFGHDIDHYIKDSEPIYKDKLNKIMNDKFYTELNLKPEKDKMRHKSTNKINLNITKLLSNIRNSIGRGKSKSTSNYNTNFINNQNNQERISNLKNTKNFTENEFPLNKKTIDYDERVLFDKRNKNEINSIFNTEQMKLSKSIDKYKLNLNKIKIPLLGEENQENKKLNIELPNIKMLYYQKPKSIKNLKDDAALRVNLNKLLPYSKYGRYMVKQKSDNKVLKTQDKLYFMTETSNNKKNNYESTNDMVISSAQNNIKLKNNYSFKRNKIKDLLEIKMPTLDEYETILNNKIKKIKEDRINRNREIHKKQSLNFLTNKEFMNYKINKHIKLLKEKEKELCK